MMRLRRLLALVVALACPLAATAEEPAAVVSRYLPVTADHAIERSGGAAAVVSLGTPLFAGDTVTVVEGGSLLLTYADGETAEIQGGTSYTVPAREPIGFVGQVYGRLQAVLGRQYRQGGNLATRGDGSCDDGREATPLAVPALKPVTHLTRGHADLSLAWLGGCAPYSLAMTSRRGPVFRADGLTRPQARLATPGLAAGEYTVTVHDARGEEFAARVVVHEALPAGPFDRDRDTTELGAVAYAAWLANHDDGRWRLESFQQLRPWIRRGSTLAGTYGDLVLWGDPTLPESDGGG